MTMRTIPNRPSISDILIKASANVAFRAKLLANPQEALTEMNLAPEDAELLSNVDAPTLKEYAHQLKTKLLLHYR